MLYLRRLSGQEKDLNVVEIDHSYSKPWNVHPDPNIRSRPARFLFMTYFPKHYEVRHISDEDAVDVESVEVDTLKKDLLPFISEVSNVATSKGQGASQEPANDLTSDLPSPNKQGWTSVMNKLWTRTVKVLHSDRLAKLTYENLPDEIILKRNLMDRTCNKLRQVFASVAAWDSSLLSWLQSTLNEHMPLTFMTAYHEALQSLRQKLPQLVDKFYVYPKSETSGSVTRSKISGTADPVLTVLNNHKPKRISSSPLFLIVPNGPQIPHTLTSQRMKHWNNLFGSLGKVITITINPKSLMRAVNCLHEIRLAVRDKIKECKTTFNEGRPLVLVGFGASSLIAAHCALNNAAYVTATICLGFPLTGINGFRGDLDDPLLETTVPTLFVIGQNSTMSTLDDMEDFRERITKTETGLVVVGGANDRLIVCSSKKKFTGITQAMVDRCISDEISDFINHLINPNHNTSDHSLSASGTSGGGASGRGQHVTGRASVGNSPQKQGSPLQKKRRKPSKKSDPEESPASAKSHSEKSDEPPAKRKSSEARLHHPVVEKKAITEAPVKSEETPVKSEERTQEGRQQPLQQLQEQEQQQPKPQQPEAVEQKQDQEQQQAPPTQPPTDHSSEAGSSASTLQGFERHYGWSYGVAELPTVISSGTTRTRHIRAPKQLDM